MFNIIKSLFAPAATKTTAGKLAEKFGLELKGNPDTVNWLFIQQNKIALLLKYYQ